MMGVFVTFVIHNDVCGSHVLNLVSLVVLVFEGLEEDCEAVDIFLQRFNMLFVPVLMFIRIFFLGRLCPDYVILTPPVIARIVIVADMALRFTDNILLAG